MRKIDVTDYTAHGNTESGLGEVPYHVKESIALILLYNPEARLDVHTALKHQKIAQKVEDADGVVLLEEEEYQFLKNALERVRGVTGADLPLCHRIMEAPEVEVQEAKPNGLSNPEIN